VHTHGVVIYIYNSTCVLVGVIDSCNQKYVFAYNNNNNIFYNKITIFLNLLVYMKFLFYVT